jgi:hypothetical protein
VLLEIKPLETHDRKWRREPGLAYRVFTTKNSPPPCSPLSSLLPLQIPAMEPLGIKRRLDGLDDVEEKKLKTFKTAI